jgi:hypothetical protein
MLIGRFEEAARSLALAVNAEHAAVANAAT